MFRRWISKFWREHKDKITQLAKGAFILIIISLIASAIFTIMSGNTEEEVEEELYNPSRTVIIGKDVSEEKYEEDSQIIDKFIEYCNSGDEKNSYSLLSDDCKDMFYPTVEEFKKNYLDKIFDQQRIYNLQSWIVKENTVTYRIRILDDLLSTGSYNDSVKYEDYITVDNSKEDGKISVNSFIRTEELNLETNTDEFYAKVLKKNVYLDYEEYTLTVKNSTGNTIKLDSLETFSGTVLVGDNDLDYYIEDINEVYLLGSKINSQSATGLTIKFKKNYSDDVESSYIEFKDIIKNADEYESTENYEDRLTLKINLQ